MPRSLTHAVPTRQTLRALQALADENRLKILEALRGGERCVCELQEDLRMGQSLLSHHLRTLRESGLVLGRRQGRWVHYSLATDSLLELEEHIRNLREDAPPPGRLPRACPD